MTNKEASYDLAPAPVPAAAVALHSTTNSTVNLVKSESDYCLPNGHHHHHLAVDSNGHIKYSKYSKAGGYKLNTWHDYWCTTWVVAWKNFTRLRRNIP